MAILLTTAALLSQIDPFHATNLTLFHEYQPKYSSLGLENQDTGDIRGDAYFVLRGLSLPVECSSKHPFKFDCDNPEQNNTQNVVSMHIVTVDDRFGPYGSCNVDDKSGTYSCKCGSYSHPEPCKAPVGRADVKERETGPGHTPRPGAEDWMWWRTNLALKFGSGTPAYWYSTTTAGKCSTPAADAPCTWKLVETRRRIVAKCLETRVAQAIRKYDPSCFTQCAQPTNASSPCVARCYLTTILSPAGSSRPINATEGMPAQLILDAWLNAFTSADPAKGGCPDAPHDLAELEKEEEEAAAWPLAWGRRAAIM